MNWPFSNQVINLNPNLLLRTLVVAFIAAIIIATCLFTSPSCQTADAASTITLTAPNGTELVSESNDFAIEQFSDPWDFNQVTDVHAGHYYEGIGGLSISSGKLAGFSTNPDPQFFLLFPCYLDAQPLGRDGLINRIDTSQYDHFSIRMYSENWFWGQIFWFYNQVWTSFGSQTFFVSPGWNIYTLDLGSDPVWTGEPIGLRVDPANLSGEYFEVDWIKLYKDDPDNNNVTISWTDSSPGGTAWIYADLDTNPDNDNASIIGWKSSQANNNYSWNTSSVPAGTYYIYISKDGENSSYAGPVTINQPPLIEILDPDDEGGEDYATAVTGDPWDMNQISDISSSANAYNLQFTGVMSGVNQNDDPYFYLRVPTPINTDRYHRLTFRFRYDNDFNFGYGTMTRVIWNPDGLHGPSFQISDDIVTYPEWTTYTLDLKNCWLDYGTYGWNGWIPTFRFDPLEVPTPRWFHLDYIKICADDEATTSFPIKWQDNRASPPATTVSIYYDTNNSGYDGTLIEQNINQVSGVNTYNWNTKSVPGGTYYIYIVADDGTSTSRRYSSGPVRVPDKNWHVNKSTGTGFEATTAWADLWGNPQGEIPLTGDFNGDTLTDIAIYRPSNSGWYVKLSTGTSFVSDTSWSTAWGNPGGGDAPLVGDFNGDGNDDVAIYRRTSYPNIFVNLSDGSSFTGTGWSTSWGNLRDAPFIGDFNGDSRDDIGIHRNGSYPNWFVTLSTGSSFSGGWGTSWGNVTGDTPLVGDFDGDGNSDIGIRRLL